MTAENPHAGQGAVLVDIGDDIGALIVRMPEDLLGVEVEIVPTGTAHDHTHPHEHGDEHRSHPPHVAVIARPLPDGAAVASLVFGSLPEGTYDLYVRPDGPVRLTASVTGGQVTETAWPAVPDRCHLL